MKTVAPPPRQDRGPLGPIQLIPPGLIGLLQLKQLGRLPGALSDVVAPVLELRDWYLQSNRVGLGQANGNAVPSAVVASGTLGGQLYTTNPVAVPEGQIWYIENYSVICTGIGVAATDLVRFAPAVLPLGDTSYLVGPDVADYQLAIRARQTECLVNRGFWLRSGDRLGFFIFDLVVGAGNATFTGSGRVTSLPL